jgi:hypothetical protein
VSHTADLHGMIDKRGRHEKSAASRQPRIAAVRNRELDERVEHAIETGERRTAAVERDVSNASDEELLPTDRC